jgi:hypothetical protein
MKLKIELGMGGLIRYGNWYKALQDFPKVIAHGGSNWEWISYDADKSGQADYSLIFGKTSSYSSYYGVDAPMLDTVLDTGWGSKCECGSAYTSFPNVHMFYCPKWGKS